VHDLPRYANAGDHSVKAPLNIGLTDASRRTADMPLYTRRRISTGETMQTTDPGRAMVTGKWADIGKFKGPILRGLAARAPYFHNGFAATLDEVLDFYESRFNIGLTARARSDLIAFLRALSRSSAGVVCETGEGVLQPSIETHRRRDHRHGRPRNAPGANRAEGRTVRHRLRQLCAAERRGVRRRCRRQPREAAVAASGLGCERLVLDGWPMGRLHVES
jgi:hypothetical protein